MKEVQLLVNESSSDGPVAHLVSMKQSSGLVMNADSFERGQREVSLWSSFKRNGLLIWGVMKDKVILMAMFYFVLSGFLIPQLEDVQYYFLTDSCHLTQEQYDILNVCQSTGLIIGTLAFTAFFKEA
jgi:hypothetical protein